MTTLTKTPPKIALIGDPTIFGVHSNNKVITPGVKAQLQILFSAAAANGDEFTLEWNDNVVTFTAAASPDGSGTEIQDNSLGITYSAWLTRIIKEIGSNYLLQEDFLIYKNPNNNNIVFFAKNAGADYTLTISNVTAPVTQEASTVGVTEVTRDFYNIMCSVFQNSVKLGEDLLPLNANNVASFDVSDYLKSVLLTEFTYPQSAGITKRDNVCVPYNVRYAESYGTPPEIYKVKASSTFWALNGRLPNFQLPTFYNANLSPYDYLIQGKRWLTFQPNNKKVYPDEPQHLYFLFAAYMKPWDVTLKTRVVWHDGTYNDGTIGTVNASQFDVWECNVSLSKALASLSVQGNKTPVTYYVWLEMTNITTTIISEIRSFVVEHRQQPYIKYFTYKNSLGGMDNLATIGVGQYGNSISRNMIQQLWPRYHDVMSRQNKPSNISAKERVTVTTGWKSKDEIIALQEMWLSEDVYLLDSRAIAVNITSSSINQHADDDFLYSLTFEYEVSNQNSGVINQAGGIGNGAIGTTFVVGNTI